MLPAGTRVVITQTVGGNVTVRGDHGLYRIAREDTGALPGYSPENDQVTHTGEFSESAVWAALKTCFDPEIPVNIVDLGLVYDLSIEKTTAGGKKVGGKKNLTAPGCGPGAVVSG